MSQAPAATGAITAHSTPTAFRFVTKDATERMCRRSVPGKIVHGAMNHPADGQSSWMPDGGLGSAPSQSIRRCEPYAAPHKSATRQSILPVTFPVTAAAIINTTATATKLCVKVRCAPGSRRSASGMAASAAQTAARRHAGSRRRPPPHAVARPASAWPIGLGIGGP